MFKRHAKWFGFATTLVVLLALFPGQLPTVLAALVAGIATVLITETKGS
jgi:hypothetical protein